MVVLQSWVLFCDDGKKNVLDLHIYLCYNKTYKKTFGFSHLSFWLEMSHQIDAILSNILSNREKENLIDCKKEENKKAN